MQIGFKWIKLAFSVGELFVVICGNLWLIFLPRIARITRMIFCLISLNLCEKFEPPGSSSRKRFRSVAKKESVNAHKKKSAPSDLSDSSERETSMFVEIIRAQWKISGDRRIF